ncbi:hypothetical protein JCM9279_006985 [Rhodotorula babjevae]
MASSRDLISPSSQEAVIVGPPVFPQEVFALILEHLEPVEHSARHDARLNDARLKAESAQRELGYRMQRVCTAWWVLGRRIAWSSVTYFWNANDYLIEGLLMRPELAREIRELAFRPSHSKLGGPRASIDRRRRAPDKVVKLIEMCSTRLDVLSVYTPYTGPEDPTFWPRIFSSAMTTTLRDLAILARVPSEEVMVKLVRGLAAFTNVRRLTLAIFDSSGWQPRTLDAALLGRLGAFDRLEKISFVSIGQDGQLPFFVEYMASLPALEEAFFEPRPREDAEPLLTLARSPVSLGRLLEKMPPRIKLYSVGGGLFFVNDLGLPTASLPHSPQPEVRLQLSLKIDGAQMARAAVLVRRTNANGVQLWSILPKKDNSAVGDQAGRA